MAVLVAVNFSGKTIFALIQLPIFAPSEVSVIVTQILDAPIVQARFLTLQTIVVAAREIAGTYALIHAIFLTNFAIANFARICDSWDNKCVRAEERE